MSRVETCRQDHLEDLIQRETKSLREIGGERGEMYYEINKIIPFVFLLSRSSEFFSFFIVLKLKRKNEKLFPSWLALLGPINALK